MDKTVKIILASLLLFICLLSAGMPWAQLPLNGRDSNQESFFSFDNLKLSLNVNAFTGTITVYVITIPLVIILLCAVTSQTFLLLNVIEIVKFPVKIIIILLISSLILTILSIVYFIIKIIYGENVILGFGSILFGIDIISALIFTKKTIVKKSS